MKNNYIYLIFFFIIKKIYRIISFKKNTSIDEYPIHYNSIKNYHSPLGGKKNKNEGYFLRYFNNNIKNKYFIDNFFLIKYSHFFNYELIYGKIAKTFNFSSKKNLYLIPISPLKNINIKLNFI